MSVTESSPLDAGINGAQEINFDPQSAHAPMQTQLFCAPQMGSSNCESPKAFNDPNFDRNSNQRITVNKVS